METITQQEKPYTGPERRMHAKPIAVAKRTLTWLAFVAWSIPVILMIVAYTENAPLRFTNEPFPYDDSRVYTESGEITFRLEYCASKDLSYDVTRRLRSVDTGLEYFISNGSTLAENGCHMVVGQPTKLPQKIEPGRYEMVYTIRSFGMVRYHRAEVHSAIFTITERQ